jgi:hypothetical protein
MIDVVLDANALKRDRFFSKHASRLLVREAREGRIRLVIPEVVLDEAINLYREDVSKQQVNITRATLELRQLRADPGIDVEALVVNEPLARYREFLGEIIAAAGATVAPYPSIAHTDVVDRALRRDRPFDPEGKDGYRDTLIWETIKQLARQHNHPIVLVSADPKAFSPGKDSSSLHRNLLSELQALGVAEDRVTRLSDVKDFTDAHIPNVEPERVEIEHRIATEPLFRDDAYEQIAAGLLELSVGQPTDGSLPIDLPVDVDQVSVTWVNGVHDLDVLSAKPFDDDVLVELGAGANVDLELRVRKSDAPFLGADVYVHDADVNESFVRARTEVELSVEVEAIYRDGRLLVVEVPEHTIGF